MREGNFSPECGLNINVFVNMNMLLLQEQSVQNVSINADIRQLRSSRDEVHLLLNFSL